MSVLKRILSVIFSLLGLLSIAVLSAPWTGIGAQQVAALINIPEFWLFFQTSVALTVGYFIAMLIVAFIPRKKSATIKVMSVDGGEISVTKSAVASQATHIVKGLGVGTTKDVNVAATKSGDVSVDVKVVPYESIDITSEAPVLHDALVTGLGAMCGERLSAVNLEFLEPQHPSSLVVAQDEDDEDAGADTGDAGSEASASEEPSASSTDDTGDITIPMHSEKSE